MLAAEEVLPLFRVEENFRQPADSTSNLRKGGFEFDHL
jgi:hypothetical protein